MEDSKLAVLFGCAKCKNPNRPRLQVGLVDQHTLRVWCPRHNVVVRDFLLAETQNPICDDCKIPIFDSGHGRKH